MIPLFIRSRNLVFLIIFFDRKNPSCISIFIFHIFSFYSDHRLYLLLDESRTETILFLLWSLLDSRALNLFALSLNPDIGVNKVAFSHYCRKRLLWNFFNHVKTDFLLKPYRFLVHLSRFLFDLYRSLEIGHHSQVNESPNFILNAFRL